MLLGAAESAAEARTPGSPPPVPIIQIGAERLAPSTLQAGETGEFVLANASTALARVEFRVKRGTRLQCQGGDGRLVSGRKFLIENGDTLRCEAPDGKLEYAVFRNLRGQGGTFRTQRSDGRIEH